MKSRKLRAVFAALSAIAVLATAMTGFAATVTTTTEYQAYNAEYAHVTSVVTGANGDVTYLATTSADAGVNSSGILYIDQKEATGSSVTFDYLVKKSDIDGVNTKVALGTNGTESITQPTNGIVINNVPNRDGEGYTVEFGVDVYGNGDGSVPAVVTAKPGYEIVDVIINGESQGIAASYNVPIHPNGSLRSIQVEVNQTYVTPEIAAFENQVADDNNSVVTILKPYGTWAEVGVTYFGYEFPATGTANADGYVAVKLVDDKEIIMSQLDNYIK